MLHINALSKSFRSGSETVLAVDEVSLEVDPGELLVLLGPSGCGKTTLLRCVAGLESADRGSIAFGSKIVYDGAARIDTPPNKRNIGMVFQSYALWPHKSVRRNIGYPLAVRRMRRELHHERWVEAAAELVDCSHLLDRYPGQLSGGQQQRVALARGLVARPDLLLFDEPLSNLDALLRTQVRNELHALHGRIGFTGLYVTHDQAEALALGDRLAIMRAGRIEQIGLPRDVYDQPVTEYAANFVGFANKIGLRRHPDGWATAAGSAVCGELPLAPGDGIVNVRFRPEFARVCDRGRSNPGELVLPATFVDSVYSGTHDEVTVTAGGSSVVVRSADRVPQRRFDAPVDLCVMIDRARFYDGEGRAIAADRRGTLHETR